MIIITNNKIPSKIILKKIVSPARSLNVIKFLVHVATVAIGLKKAREALLILNIFFIFKYFQIRNHKFKKIVIEEFKKKNKSSSRVVYSDVKNIFLDFFILDSVFYQLQLQGATNFKRI